MVVRNRDPTVGGGHLVIHFSAKLDALQPEQLNQKKNINQTFFLEYLTAQPSSRTHSAKYHYMGLLFPKKPTTYFFLVHAYQASVVFLFVN